MNLAGTIDLTGKSDPGLAVSTLNLVAERYKEVGVEVSRPIVLVIEDIPIMGASEPVDGAYRLHIGSHAVGSGMLDGLMAHEMAHMALMDRNHPSHSRAVHQRVSRTLAVPKQIQRGVSPLIRVAINHIQDIYADDLAFHLIGDDRAGAFFSNWVRNASVVGGNRFQSVANEVTVAFGLGNMQRHGIKIEDIVTRQATEFAAGAELAHMPEMILGFRELPISDDVTLVEGAMVELLERVVKESMRR